MKKFFCLLFILFIVSFLVPSQASANEFETLSIQDPESYSGQSQSIILDVEATYFDRFIISNQINTDKKQTVETVCVTNRGLLNQACCRNTFDFQFG